MRVIWDSRAKEAQRQIAAFWDTRREPVAQAAIVKE